MTNDLTPLDGNAAGGFLTELFALEMTRALLECDACGREGPLATLLFYGGAGAVLRCPACGAVNLRLVDAGGTLHVDLRGCTRISVRACRDTGRDRTSGS
jgi:hypothetical protein